MRFVENILPKASTKRFVVVTVALSLLATWLYNTVFGPVLEWAQRETVEFFGHLSARYSDSLYARMASEGTDTYSELPFFVAGMVWIWSIFKFNASSLESLKEARTIRDSAAASVVRHNELMTKVEAIADSPEKHREIVAKSQQEKSQVEISLKGVKPWSKEFRDLVASEGPKAAMLKVRAEKTYRMVRMRALITSCLSLCIMLYYIHVESQATYARSAARFVERSLDILGPALAEKRRMELRSQYRSATSVAKFTNLYDDICETAKTANLDLPSFNPILRRDKPRDPSNEIRH